MGKSRSKAEQLQTRRAEVNRLRIRGYSVRQISQFMNYPPTTVHRDIQYTDLQYLKESEQYIKKLPAELNRIRLGVNEVLQMVWGIADNTNLDAKTRLQAAGLINDTYRLSAELADGSIDVEKMRTMLSRTQHEAEEITAAIKQEVF